MSSFGTFHSVNQGGGQGPPYNPNKDIELTSPPNDSISSICWSPVANFVVASSWDNQIRCWEVAATGQSVPKAVSQHDQPVLCTDWSPDGSHVFSGAVALLWWLLHESCTHSKCLHERVALNGLLVEPCKQFFYSEYRKCKLTVSFGTDKFSNTLQ